MDKNKSHQIHIKVYGDIDDKISSQLLFCYMTNGRDEQYKGLCVYDIDGIKYTIGEREYRKSMRKQT